MDLRQEQRLEQELLAELSLKQRLALRLADILWHRHYDIVELILAFMWMLWGLALLNPAAAAFASAPATFRVMHSIMPEEIWGALALFFGFNELVATMWEYRPWRIVASGKLLLWSLFVGSMIGLSNPFGTGIVVYLSLASIALFVFLRAFKDFPESRRYTPAPEPPGGWR